MVLLVLEETRAAAGRTPSERRRRWAQTGLEEIGFYRGGRRVRDVGGRSPGAPSGSGVGTGGWRGAGSGGSPDGRVGRQGGEASCSLFRPDRRRKGGGSTKSVVGSGPEGSQR